MPNPLRASAYYWVPAGLLDDEANLKVGVHLFVGSKASWDKIASGGAQFENMPELAKLIRLCS